MRNLIPHFIREQFARRAHSGSLQAATVFVDISGFTPLTETLMQYHKDGAEVLTEVLSGIFDPLVAEVYARGGFISGFAGDAFTALFPRRAGETGEGGALQTAFFVQRFFAEHGLVQTKYGAFEMGVKVGLSIGEVEWGILGAGGRHAYFFRGPAVEGCTQAEDRAEQGEIIADGQIWPHVQAQVEAIPLGDHFRLTALASVGDLPRFPAPPSLVREDLVPFVLDAAIDLALSGMRGEFRNIASVFISFQPPADNEILNGFVSHVLELAGQYGGYFKDMGFGVKGAVIVCTFGAPVAHENDLERAADFILALQAKSPAFLRKLGFSPVNWRVGLTYGTVYAGMMGGVERCEYTAIGDVVNFAARLMQRAEWGEVWMSAPAAEGLEQSYQVEPLGTFSFKGKRGKLPAYLLAGRKAAVGAAFFAGEMVGREDELARLTEFVQPIFEGRFAGMVYIYGDAGMGKSRLAYELRRCLTTSPRVPGSGQRGEGVRWFLCPTDEILRQSLNPFKYFLRRYFAQSSDATADESKARFDQRLDQLIRALGELGHARIPSSQFLIAELVRTRSFLGALADLHWEGSLYQQLEPELRFENTLIAFKTLVLAESLRRPVVLQLEDLHWLDTDSEELVRLLTRNVEGYPLVVLCTSRYRDDGSQVTLAVDDDVPQQVVELDTLTPVDIRTFAGEVLGADGDEPSGRPISDELEQFLLEKTAGSPFFVEQLLLDLRERGGLRVHDGRWIMVQERIEEVPARIGAVLIARLDRLAARVKEVVQTAAVLGREFEVQVLSQMLREDVQLLVQVKRAEVERIWSALSEIRYIFRHALMRDAAYEMQLKARLRGLHRLAAEAIEQVHAQDLASHYADVVHHYGRAEDVERERRYARLAGEQAAARFANAEAIVYLSRALELTPVSDAVGRYALLLAREGVYDLLGAREAQAEDLAALEAQVETLRDDRPQETGWRTEVMLRRARYAEMIGDYPSAIAAGQAAVELGQVAQDVRSEVMGYLQRGRILLHQWNLAKARPHFEQAWALAQAAQLRRVEADCLLPLGIISARLGNLDEARPYFEQTLRIAHEAADLRLEISSLLNLGNVSIQQGDHDGARGFYERTLRLCRQIGFRRAESLALNNLGNISLWLGDYAGTRAHFERALRIKREVGDRRGENIVLRNLGAILISLGDFDGARDHLEQGLDICCKIGDRQGEGVTLSNLGLLFHHLGDDRAAADYSQQAVCITEELGDGFIQGYALTHLGHALAGLGYLAEASDAYREALDVRCKLGQRNLGMESLAGLASVSLSQGKLAQALAHVEEILAFLEDNTLAGTEEPFRVYLTCCQVLRANQDSRARGILTAAYELLQERAGKIVNEELKHSFLENVAAHREIVRLSEQDEPGLAD